MKLPILSILVLSIGTQLLPAQESHEETVVRNSYAKLAFQCSLHPLVKPVSKEITFAPVVEASIKDQIVKATPVISLSDFKTGTVASIADEPWGDFVSQPTQDDWVLEGATLTVKRSDSGVPTEYKVAEVHWVHAHPGNPEGVAQILKWPVSKIIENGGQQWVEGAAKYTRYASYTVDVTFQDRSTGPRKALFFFGTDAKGNEVVAQNDMFSGPQPLWDVLNQPVYPAGLLQSKGRDTPLLADWIRANTMPASLCPNTKHDLCCSGGRCGLSQADVQRDLNTPVPPDAN